MSDERAPKDEVAAKLAIMELKARYFRYLDAQDWDHWRETFTPDAVMDKPEEVQRLIDFGFTGLTGEDRRNREGREALVAGHAKVMQNIVTVHQGHMPEIEFQSATEATGIWAVNDIIRQTENGQVREFEGYGYYHERYVCDEEGRWRISHQTMSRVYFTLRTESATH